MELWIKLILCVTIVNIFGFFIMKYLTGNNNSFIVVNYLFIGTGILSLFSLFYLHNFTTISIKPKNIYLLIILSIMNFVSYSLLINAVKYADNPGFVRAFVALEISTLAIVYSFYYKETLNSCKIIGICSIVFGIIMLTIS